MTAPALPAGLQAVRRGSTAGPARPDITFTCASS